MNERECCVSEQAIIADPEIARAGLEAYDAQRAGGMAPVLNSITALRAEAFELLKVALLRPILLISENVVDGKSSACHTAEETHQAARDLVGLARRAGLGRGGAFAERPDW